MTTKEKEEVETERESGTDGPLLDLSDDAVKKMIKAAKKQAEATTRMSKLEREELYGKAVRARAEEAGDPPAAPASSVVAAHFRQMPDPARDAEQPKVAPGVIDFAAMAARQRPSELAEDDDEQAEFMRRALAGVRARNGLPPAE